MVLFEVLLLQQWYGLSDPMAEEAIGDRLWDRLRYADEVGCRNLVLNSNGTLLNRNDNIEKVLDSPLKRFILSLDGYTKETFEKIRYRASWDRVYSAVAELCRRKAERGSEYPVIEKNREKWSSHLSFFTADKVPSHTPKTMIGMNANVASSSVAGKNARSASVTSILAVSE